MRRPPTSRIARAARTGASESERTLYVENWLSCPVSRPLPPLPPPLQVTPPAIAAVCERAAAAGLEARDMVGPAFCAQVAGWEATERADPEGGV